VRPLEAERLDPAALQQLAAGASIQMDHYGGGRLPFACLSADGVTQRMVALDGPRAGERFDLIDASGGYASACLGANHPVVRQALADGLTHGYCTDEVVSFERAALLNELFGEAGVWSDRFPAAAYHVSGRNSGSEGLELALRLVLEHGFDRRSLAPRAGSEARQTLVAFEGAWHGWTTGTQALLNRRHYRIGLPDPLAGGPRGVTTIFLPFGDEAAIAALFAERGHEIAGVFIEPIQGDAGVIVPPPRYLRRVSSLCREHGALLVADEVLTFAKSGAFFAMTDDEGPVPSDITVIGKSLGMGAVSASMVIARRELEVRPSGAVSTSDLRPLTCAIIRAGLRHIITERLIERSRDRGERLRALLAERVAGPHPTLVGAPRGRGLINGLELTDISTPHVAALRRALLEAGVYIEVMGGAGRRSGGRPYSFPALRVAPPLIVSDTELVAIVDRMAAGVDRFARELA
jgi:acetylornithine/N-succinyldiaminopimelate aminotransferase